MSIFTLILPVASCQYAQKKHSDTSFADSKERAFLSHILGTAQDGPHLSHFSKNMYNLQSDSASTKHLSKLNRSIIIHLRDHTVPGNSMLLPWIRCIINDVMFISIRSAIVVRPVNVVYTYASDGKGIRNSPVCDSHRPSVRPARTRRQQGHRTAYCLILYPLEN